MELIAFYIQLVKWIFGNVLIAAQCVLCMLVCEKKS